ncbi:MAG: flagellar filament capping protein FliD [Deltaproteobacteria bacterium]|nr:flagellar filament capping protein FliD [Deltaproteobacteria bacterium]
MSTNLISGLSSGFDWQTMIDQLIAVDHQRVDTVSEKKTSEAAKLTEWQSLNTKLLALKTAAGNLKDPEAFGVFKAAMTTDSATVKASDLLTATTSSTASAGSYSLKVNNLAAAQKLSSTAFTSVTSALGAGYAGDILINGKVITITATDTLSSVGTKINNANSGTAATGVTASIISYGASDYRLVLTSDDTGASGISLSNGGSTDLIKQFGLLDTGRTAKNHLAGGDRTDRFTSTSTSIKSLLGLTDAQISGVGDLVINGQAGGAIDLNTDTLSSLQTKFAAAGLTVSITSETEDSQTYYRLMVSGSANTYTDKNNILETLGFIKGGVSDVYGVTGDIANTSGGAAITADTLIKDIDGYTGYLNTDYIHLEGTDTNGMAVLNDSLVLSNATTVGDLLTKIQSLFGDVTASITSNGKLIVTDNTPGASPLALKTGVKNSGGTDDNTLLFDANGDLGCAVSVRKRQLVAGADVSVMLDGVTVTRSSNTIDDILTGVTLDLLKADTGTTVTLNISQDIDAIMAKINTFVTSYNSISSYISTQNTYDATKKTTGGILFGDGTLSSVKSDLTSILTQSVWGVSSDYSTLGLVGVSVDRYGQLSVDEEKLSGYLTTNFNDVKKLFSADGEASVGDLSYIAHGKNTKRGDYTVHIDTAATKSTSAASNNTSLSGAETLTITEGSKVATVNLASGLTMTQIVNAVNSELATAGLDISAAADSGSHLILSSSTYGAGHSFTIHQLNNLLWTGGDQVVNNGVDVAGTINGEAATGVGQVLTGNSGAANIDGLVVTYTGSTTGDVGTMKLTLGVAELYDRALFHITDSIDGYVSYKQQSIQSSMSRYDKQIDEMEAQLARKKEQLTNRFVQMELAIQKVQSQSNWLTGQLTAAENGWK